uniref:Proteasome maturation factor-like protein n=1 Tax=Oryza sativa subsp. japonica TaxID=39947 RepID=Q69LX5_ORYSJ|nr:proteasome maturation factor-like protein [Oryza sativa Japonica Group]BAD36401.1 proteasome maturation factor-like protein [Oryza sativa Japonica Group]
MASGSIVKKEVGENHDVLRFGFNNSVKGDLAPQHPIQATVHKEAKFWADKKRFGAEAIYGSAFNIRKDLDAQILSKHVSCCCVGYSDVVYGLSKRANNGPIMSEYWCQKTRFSGVTHERIE